MNEPATPGQNMPRFKYSIIKPSEHHLEELTASSSHQRDASLDLNNSFSLQSASSEGYKTYKVSAKESVRYPKRIENAPAATDRMDSNNYDTLSFSEQKPEQDIPEEDMVEGRSGSTSFNFFRGQHNFFSNSVDHDKNSKKETFVRPEDATLSYQIPPPNDVHPQTNLGLYIEGSTHAFNENPSGTEAPIYIYNPYDTIKGSGFIENKMSFEKNTYIKD